MILQNRKYYNVLSNEWGVTIFALVSRKCICVGLRLNALGQLVYKCFRKKEQDLRRKNVKGIIGVKIFSHE
jgi:hypothetical protein